MVSYYKSIARFFWKKWISLFFILWCDSPSGKASSVFPSQIQTKRKYSAPKWGQWDKVSNCWLYWVCDSVRDSNDLLPAPTLEHQVQTQAHFQQQFLPVVWATTSNYQPRERRCGLVVTSWPAPGPGPASLRHWLSPPEPESLSLPTPVSHHHGQPSSWVTHHGSHEQTGESAQSCPVSLQHHLRNQHPKIS